jgi:hypothetical protein
MTDPRGKLLETNLLPTPINFPPIGLHLTPWRTSVETGYPSG